LGSDPFLEFDENPFDLVALRLNGMMIARHRITGKTISVNNSTIEKEILSSIDSTRPDSVLGFSLAAGLTSVGHQLQRT